MCFMQAQGKTVKEIATATNYSVEGVRNIQRQPWYKQRFLRTIAENGGDKVKAFLEGQALNSLETLVEIQNDAKTPASVRVASANSILDRALGKAIARVETTVKRDLGQMGEELSEVEKELERVQAELKANGITTGRS